MKIQFDSHQEYQLEAVKAAVDVFDGQPLAQGQYEVRLEAAGGEMFTELGYGNTLVIGQEKILENVREVQERNGIPASDVLDGMNFSVEMETGTGKTYVYLRTLFELHRQYGLTKFIVVVPSVAIREGVVANIRLTQEHFAAIYGNVPLDAWVYDAKQVSRLRDFATKTNIQVLVINIDAFNKIENNVIHRENDKLSGRKPVEFIQAANPIVIVDEPQNMESGPAKAAIETLNPLCTLRYSATHRNTYNLLYKLDPVRAYDLRLVKHIEVDSVLDDPDFNQPYIHVKSIQATKAKITAKLEVDVQEKNGPTRKTLSISRDGVDLYDETNERAAYRGYIVDEIDAGQGFISFSNGTRLYEGDTSGGRTEEVMKVQIRQTVKAHLDKELYIRRKLPEGQRLKVLSLFFIDRVANYAEEDGRIRKWFIEAYTELATKADYKPLNPLPVDVVHNGYFAVNKGKAKDTNGNTKADDDAYALIMQEKERLLSPDEPLRFIFSHSALREGWDNPNVFQICTLNETKSEIKKRQEIGRGLRLPVLETGERCFDPAVDQLSVIANESYDDFARKLQTEIEEECGVTFGDGRIKNKRDRRKVELKKGWRLNEDFQALWERIKHKTRYAVDYSTDKMIEEAAKELKGMDKIVPPKIAVRKAQIKLEKDGVTATVTSVKDAEHVADDNAIPDLLGYLQRETELTRGTLAKILIQSGRLGEVKVNPQQFIDQALKAIRATLHSLMIDGIKYEKIAGEEWEMLLFEENEIIGYVSRLLDVGHSIYDAIEFESGPEYEFAKALDARDDIKLFIKLPAWFKVETPIGTYNPDWAIVKQPDGETAKLYLIRETKGTKDKEKLRGSEWDKIRCGKAHFDALAVDFKHVTSANEV